MRMPIDGADIFFDVEGGALSTTPDGLRAKPTIIALHGGPGFDHGYLRPGLAPLADAAQIVYVDLRGQGRSTTPDITTCTLERMADDVAELCQRVGIERPVVLGHSAGGFVALHLAIRHPRSVGGLILCDTTPTLGPLPSGRHVPGLDERAGPEALAAAGRLFGGDFSPEAQEEFGRLAFPFYSGPRHMDVPPRLWRLTSFNGDVAGFFFGTQAMHYDVRDGLAGIRVPTLVVTGDYDWVVSPAGSDVLAREIVDAKLIELAGTGHFGFIEESPQFVREVRAYLARLEPVAA